MTKEEQLKEQLANGFFESADAYYAAKDQLREIQAAKRGMTVRELDPMYFWYGRQSN